MFKWVLLDLDLPNFSVVAGFNHFDLWDQRCEKDPMERVEVVDGGGCVLLCYLPISMLHILFLFVF